MKVVPDVYKCQGHGRCYDLAPKVFDADDEGRVVMLVGGELGGALEREARIAVENCPEHALQVTE
jgi:ferredoxin